MLTYTLGFIQRGSQILLINRKKKPWLGCWNGLGGKIKKDEDAKSCMIREFEEETGLIFLHEDVIDCGYLTWNSFDAHGQGLHLFYVKVDESLEYFTPKMTEEGILDWKEIQWIIDPHNMGVAHNIRFFLEDILAHQKRYHFHCVFENDRLLHVTKETIK